MFVNTSFYCYASTDPVLDEVLAKSLMDFAKPYMIVYRRRALYIYIYMKAGFYIYI